MSDKYWKVTFTAEYITVATTVEAANEDEAIDYATDKVLAKNCIDVSSWMADAEEV